MNYSDGTKKVLALCGVVSFAMHLFMFALGGVGPFQLGPPVRSLPMPDVSVDLSLIRRTGDEAGRMAATAARSVAGEPAAKTPASFPDIVPLSGEQPAQDASVMADGAEQTDLPVFANSTGGNPATTTVGKGAEEGPAIDRSAVREPGEFLRAQREKLTYRLSVLGVPFGKAEIEAVNDAGEVRIRSTVATNDLFDLIYPVEDHLEIRIIGGNYIMVRIRQKEGDFRSDAGFTLSLKEKQAVWADRLTNMVTSRTLKSDRVLDPVSALYYVRTLPLAAGTHFELQIFDSDRETTVPVEAVREERVDLPGFRSVDTVVLRPRFSQEGVFGRARELMVWYGADDYRVPVKLQAVIPLGELTAELVAAETISAPHTP